MRERERLASFISGGGTTMESIFRKCLSGEIPMDVACVISSSANADGLNKARKLGIIENNIITVDPVDFKMPDGKRDQVGFGEAILDELRKRGVTVVTQNGWLPLTPPNVIEEFTLHHKGNIFNQHPGPVPDFGGKGMYGRRVHAAVLLFNRLTKRENPHTHLVAQRVALDYDQGEVIKSHPIKIENDDTVESLQKVTLPVEHIIQESLLKDVAHREIFKTPTVRYVQPGEEDQLAIAKRMAQLLYPKG